MVATNQFRKGLKVEMDGVPCEIIEFQHVSPGKGGAFTRTKFKNLLTKNIVERTLKSGDKIPRANVVEREMQFLYSDSSGYHFMDQKTYEQIIIQGDFLGDCKGFLQENIVAKVMLYNENPIGIELPTFIEAKVAKTDPAFKGDTVSGGTKPAVIETGGDSVCAVSYQRGRYD